MKGPLPAKKIPRTGIAFGPEVVDAEGAVLGRLAAKLAKRLLMGEHITVVNSEKIAVSGDPQWTSRWFLHKRQRGDPYKGPFYPRYPDRLFRRVVEGMLPENVRGREAARRLTTFIGTPEELKGKAQKYGKNASELRCKYTSLGEICAFLGAKKERWNAAEGRGA